MSSAETRTAIDCIDTDIGSWLCEVYGPVKLAQLRRSRQSCASEDDEDDDSGDRHTFVTLTYAQSLDGKISGRDGQQLQLSCPESMRVTHALRRIHSSIMVGVGTVLNDDPQLSARLPEMLPIDQQPQPVVLDSRLRTPLRSKLVQNSQRGTMPRPILICSDRQQDQTFEDAKTRLETFGAVVQRWQETEKGQIDLASLLNDASSSSWSVLGSSVMIEGGAKMISNVLAQGLANLVIVTVSPNIVGDGVSAYKQGVKYPDMQFVASKQFGTDTVVVLRRK
ncbi:hypothetical protein ACM66B_000520 [Microbotryomycetes sp. NB124-2]